MKKQTIELHPEAVVEAGVAYRWYAQHNRAAAQLFLSELEDALNAIAEDPKAYPEYLPGIRRRRLSRFPYLVIYRILRIHIQVIAIAHGHRRPRYWQDRTQ